MADKGLDPQQLSQIFSAANQTAQNEYYNAKLGGEAEDRALARAKFAWQQQLDRAGLTGMFEGSPTFDAMKDYAEMFGDWSTPQAGQKTLAAQQQAFNQQATEAGFTGTWNGNQTQAAAKQAADIAAMNAGLTGYLGGTQTLAGQQQGWQQGFSQQQQADKNRQDYLQLLSGLRGPADYGQYLKVLGSTPGGLRDLAGAAAGQYQVASGATSGAQPVPVSMGSFVNSAATGAGQQYQPGQYAYPQSQPGQAQWYGANNGYQQAQNANQTLQAQNAQYANQLQPYTYGSPAGNNMQPAAQGTSYESYMRAAQGLPPPNQISPQAYNAMTTTQKQMVGGMYEQQGWNPQDVTDLYRQSLPKYGSSGPQTGGFKFS
jgi:hypothetical protein